MVDCREKLILTKKVYDYIENVSVGLAWSLQISLTKKFKQG